MRNLNTTIATSTNGTKLVSFKATAYAEGCYFIVENGGVTSTYTKKTAGLMTQGLEIKTRVNKATCQFKDGNSSCEIEKLSFSSPMEALSYVTGLKYNGGLTKNSTVFA
jgi:hypothetical protein